MGHLFHDPKSHATYSVVLTRAPEENVRVTAAPVPLREDEKKAGGLGIQLDGSDVGKVLFFDRNNWHIPQTVTVTAPQDLLAEGRRFINIQHSVVQGGNPDDGGAYDELIVPGVGIGSEDVDADVAIARERDIPSYRESPWSEEPGFDVSIERWSCVGNI